MKEAEELNIMKEAEELNEEAKKAYKEKDFEKAAECLLRAVNICPIEGKYFHNLGLVFKETKKYKEAVSFFSKAIEFGFDHEMSYLGRGDSWSLSNEYEKAIEDYTEVLKINEDSLDARRSRGVSYINSSQDEKALEDFNAVLEKYPDDMLTPMLRWAAYKNLGMHEEAKRYFDDLDKECKQMKNPN